MTIMSGDCRKLRVLHFVDSGGMYGAESVILTLSREMLASGTYEPVIGCIVPRLADAVDLLSIGAERGVEGHRLLIKNTRLLVDLPRAAKLMKRLRIDLIHCHGYKPASFAFLINLLTGIPIIATCHLWYVDDKSPLKMRLMIAIERALYRYFPAVVAVSRRIQTVLLEAGCEAKRVHLINNGVVLADYRSKQEPQALIPGWGRGGAGEIRVLNVARLTAQKGQATLIETASCINQLGRDVRIVIVGEGELREQLQRQIASAGVAEIVSLTGFRTDIPALLQQAHLFVLTSRDEGMPISLLEAVASAVPVIATNVGDIGKLIRHGESGIIVAVGDPVALANAIVALADDAKMRAQLAANAWRLLQELYSSTQMFNRYDAIYRGVQSRPSNVR